MGACCTLSLQDAVLECETVAAAAIMVSTANFTWNFKFAGGGHMTQMTQMSLSLDDFNTRALKYEWRWQWRLRQQSSVSTVITAAQQPCSAIT